MLMAALLLAASPALDLLHVDLRILARRGERELTLTCELRFRAAGRQVGLSLHRDAKLLGVRDSSGAPLRYRRRGDGLEVTAPEALSFEQVQQWSFDYRFPLPRPLEQIPGFFSSEPLYPTALLPAGAGEIPARDPCSARIVFELPEPLLGVASGGLERRPLEPGRWSHEWNQPQPSALHAVLIGALEEHRLERGGRLFRAFLRPASRPRAAEFLQHLAEVIELLSDTIGALPLQEFNLAEQDLPAGLKGFSVPGLTVLSSSEIVDQPEFPFRILAHELSHVWWTFAVDPAGLADGLLREGLPTYTGILYAEALQGAAGLLRELANSRRIALLPRRPEPLARGFEMQNKNNAYPLNYHKGAYVLHMLRRELGEDAFARLLREYFEAGRQRRPRLEDFERIAEQVAGRSLKDFFAAWVESAAIPRVRIEHDYEDGLLRGRLIQEDAQVRARARVRLHFADGSRRDLELELRPGAQPFELACDAPPIRVELDPDHDLLTR